MTGAAAVSLERRIRAVDSALARLSPMHNKLFRQFYFFGRTDVYTLCDEMHVSRETFNRCKRDIITYTAIEMGLINLT
jgi:hypothetical protein